MAAKFLTPNFSEYLNTKLKWKCLGCNSAEVIYSHVHIPRFYLQHCKETKNTHTKKPKKTNNNNKVKMIKSFMASRFKAPNIHGLHNIFKLKISYILKPGAKQQYSTF